MRLAKVLRTTPEVWLRMQQAVDLWDAQQDASRYAMVEPLPKEGLAA